MISVKIQYKNNEIEARTFIDWKEFSEYVNPHMQDISAIVAQQIDPQDLRQGRCDRYGKSC